MPDIRESQPKLTALGVLSWRSHLLLMRSILPGRPPGWRPLGGRIAFGEPARDAVVREFLEETGRRVVVIDELAPIETIVAHRGDLGHEISFPFLVRWASSDDEPRGLSALPCTESDGSAFDARWFEEAEALAESFRLHPDGLAGRIKGTKRRV